MRERAMPVHAASFQLWISLPNCLTLLFLNPNRILYTKVDLGFYYLCGREIRAKNMKNVTESGNFVLISLSCILEYL